MKSNRVLQPNHLFTYLHRNSCSQRRFEQLAPTERTGWNSYFPPLNPFPMPSKGLTEQLNKPVVYLLISFLLLICLFFFFLNIYLNTNLILGRRPSSKA